MNVESDGPVGAYRRLLHGPGRQTFAPNIGVEPPEWTLSALCAQVDAEFWFPEKGGSTREAKKVCSACPVRAECLAYGLHDGYGIYGDCPNETAADSSVQAGSPETRSPTSDTTDAATPDKQHDRARSGA